MKSQHEVLWPTGYILALLLAASTGCAPSPARKECPDVGAAKELLSIESGPQTGRLARKACVRLQSCLEKYALQNDVAAARKELAAANEMIQWLPETTEAETAMSARLRNVAASLGKIIGQPSALRKW